MTPKQNIGLIGLAAGGTGGHMYPAESVVHELVEQGYKLVLFTDSRGAKYGGTLGDILIQTVPSATPLGKNLFGLLKAVRNIARGIISARRALKQSNVRIVIGFGGYPSVPTILAAQILGIPTVLHEQNAILGRANRLLARRAKCIATSVPETLAGSRSLRYRAVLVGNPVRPAIRMRRDAPYRMFSDVGPIRLLVMGGSQGARILSDVLPYALAALPLDLRNRLRITQQCRFEDMEALGVAYRQARITAKLTTFINDVPQKLASCHLAITRAGASTLAELTCIGRPAVLLPYPLATDDHQAANASAVVRGGGAIMIRDCAFRAHAVTTMIADLLNDRAKLKTMAANAKKFGRPGAASGIARLALDQIASDIVTKRPLAGDAA